MSLSRRLFSGLPALALAIGGCAPVAEQAAVEDPYPASRPRQELERYLRLPSIVLDDGNRRWIISSRAVREFTTGFLNYEYTVDEGIAGAILDVSQDRSRVWLATSTALQSLDKDLHFIRTYIEEPSLQALFVAAYPADRAVALTSRGVILVDALGLSSEIFPLEDVDIREVTNAVLHDGNLWVATYRGLRRFSVGWKSWDTNYGSKRLQRTAVLRLELVPDTEGDSIVRQTLYAITADDLFVYRPTFDSWERLGL